MELLLLLSCVAYDFSCRVITFLFDVVLFSCSSPIKSKHQLSRRLERSSWWAKSGGLISFINSQGAVGAGSLTATDDVSCTVGSASPATSRDNIHPGLVTRVSFLHSTDPKPSALQTARTRENRPASFRGSFSVRTVVGERVAYQQHGSL